MKTIVNLIFNHANYAHYIIFGALMLAGLNIPISEDLLIVISGIVASNMPEKTYKMFLWLFGGCYLSDIMSYFIGRKFGIKILHLKWFKKTIPQKKIDKAQEYYKKHGVKTLLIGRFIPFGIRNCLFLTAGMSKMSFIKFLLSDGVACLLSNTALFSLTYMLGKNFETIQKGLKTFHIMIFILFLILSIILIFIYKNKKKANTPSRK